MTKRELEVLAKGITRENTSVEVLEFVEDIVRRLWIVRQYDLPAHLGVSHE